MSAVPPQLPLQPEADPFYTTHCNYGDLVAAAHRRRVTAIGAPALTRHLVFWNPIDRPNPEGRPDGADTHPFEAEYSRNRRIQADRLVAAIYRILLDRFRTGRITKLRVGESPATGGDDLVPLFFAWMSQRDGKIRARPPHAAPADSYRALKICFEWQGLRTVLSMELHVEFLTLTAIIDLSRPRSGDRIGEPDLASCMATIERLFDSGVEDEKPWRACHKVVYYDVWNAFEQLIFEAPGIDGLKKSRGVSHPQRFVDFRGLILAVDSSQDGVSGPHPEPCVPRPLRRAFSRMPHRGTGNERPAACGTHEFDRIWPFLKSGFDEETTEFTLSRYLGNRAFFATALAEQRGMVPEPGSGPLCYLILEDTLNTWQLGRLVYRIHRAGTARVAAAMHFASLREADGILARIEQKLQHSLKRATPLRGQDEEEEHQARRSLRLANDEIESELATLSTDRFDGSLEYRIDRSRYYLSQFNRIAKSLRIRRVHGFQTYVEFVQQRLGPIFEYIDRIGQHHARVQGDRGILLRRLLTLEALYEERSISRAQRVADGALFGILGPYYLMSLVEHAELPGRLFLWQASVVYCLCYLSFVMLRPKEAVTPPGRRPRLELFWRRLVRWRLPVSVAGALMITSLAYRYGPTLAEWGNPYLESRPSGEIASPIRAGPHR